MSLVFGGSVQTALIFRAKEIFALFERGTFVPDHYLSASTCRNDENEWFLMAGFCIRS